MQVLGEKVSRATPHPIFRPVSSALTAAGKASKRCRSSSRNRLRFSNACHFKVRVCWSSFWAISPGLLTTYLTYQKLENVLFREARLRVPCQPELTEANLFGQEKQHNHITKRVAALGNKREALVVGRSRRPLRPRKGKRSNQIVLPATVRPPLGIVPSIVQTLF